jgi:hypothetical protein
MISQDLSKKIHNTITQEAKVLERDGVIVVIPHDTYVFLVGSEAYKTRTKGLVEGGIVDGKYAVYFGSLRE